MTEEQITAKKLFAGEKKASMKRRDDHHDYTGRRMYMITLEVEGRRPVFGRLEGDAFAPAGSADEPRIELSPLGTAVQSEWMGIHGYYPQIEVMAVQMMPDHLHGILFVKERLPVHLGQVISGFKAGCRKAEKALADAAVKPQPTEKGVLLADAAVKPQPTEKGVLLADAAAQPQPTEKGVLLADAAAKPQPTEKGVRAAEKGALVSLQGTALPSQSGSQVYRPLFAKGYNDLILRSYDELPAWQNYLRDNPRRLLMKRSRPEWLRPFFGLHICTHDYSGIGNRSLLNASRRLAVRVSRRLNEQEVEAELRRYLQEARSGTVLVSPSISPGEKRVMRAAFNEGLPTIVIMENGFTPMSKPHGEQFYACARGQLLMLSPWPHHNEKTKLTAEMCRQMNLMALEICES